MFNRHPILKLPAIRFLYVVFSFALVLTTSCGGSGNMGSGGGGEGSGGGGGGGVGGNAIQIERVEPSYVMVGVAQGLVTLAGRNFTASSTVLFDGLSVPSFFDNATLQFEVPDSAWNVAQSHTVQVSDPAGGQSNVATYEVYAPQPGPRPFVGQLTQYMSESLIINSLVPDLNGDGRADLITVTLNGGPFQYGPVVRYGQFDGTFSAPASLGSFTLQVSPNSVLAGDVNGDGVNDLILFGSYNNSTASYQVLLNDGTGHFDTAGVGNLTSSNFVPVLLGDFNHDGKLDFVSVGSTNGQAFSLFLGHGDGTFDHAVPFGASGVQPILAYTADLNSDGYSDLVYLNALSNGGNQFHVILSDGGGSYSDTQPAGLPSSSRSFVVADFNNDRIPDIFAVGGNGLGSAYLGMGNGSFNRAGSQIFGSDGFLAAPPFATGDFDNDGNLDVATRTTVAGPDEIVFLWGDGQGNFIRQPIASDQSFTLEVGDVNGDGIPDIFAGAAAGFAYPCVVLGQNGRNLPTAQILIPHALGVLSFGDVFGDGFTDLLVAGVDNNGNAGTPGTIYHFQPNGTFGIEGEAPGYSTRLVDLNGDGIPDMVGFSGTEMLVWEGDGSGVFQSPINQISLPRGFEQVYFRDLDRDGNMDVVLPGTILYGKGNFQFDGITTEFYENFVVGDFDSDGIPDIATAQGVLFGQGNRSFTAPIGSSPLPGSAPAFPTQATADVNGDGMDDLVLGIDIYISVGRQGFVHDQSLLVNGYGASISSISVADFNGDGLLDLAVGILGGGDDLVLFTNDGTGKYQITSYAIGVYSVYSVTADFNHDGKPDLAFLNYGFAYKSPAVTVLLHR